MDAPTTNKKKIFIIGGVIFVVILIGIVLAYTLSKGKKVEVEETELDLAQVSPSEEDVEKGCDKILNCLHGGKFDHTTCNCKCPPDWAGGSCGLPLWEFENNVSATLGLNKDTGLIYYPTGMSLDECKQSCEDDAKCDAFSYYPIHKAGNKRCIARSNKAASKPWIKLKETVGSTSGKTMNRNLN